jgi:hypothetical protein
MVIGNLLEVAPKRTTAASTELQLARRLLVTALLHYKSCSCAVNDREHLRTHFKRESA